MYLANILVFVSLIEEREWGSRVMRVGQSGRGSLRHKFPSIKSEIGKHNKYFNKVAISLAFLCESKFCLHEMVFPFDDLFHDKTFNHKHHFKGLGTFCTTQNTMSTDLH